MPKKPKKPLYSDDDFYRYDEDFDSDSIEYYEEPEEESLPSGDTILIEGPIYAANPGRQPFGTTWWGKEWVRALEAFYEDNRLNRGRSYARKGAVRRLEITYGQARAKVVGTRRYRTEVFLTLLSDQNWEKAFDALSGQALYTAKLLAGEMPTDIEQVFQEIGLSLFPQSLKDIRFDCTCPDYGDPCKHAAAVYYLLAEQIDADPFVLFHLRGRSREQVLGALRTRRSGSVSTDAPVKAEILALDADLSTFWGRPTAGLNTAEPAVPNTPPLLDQFGDPPGEIRAELRLIYQTISAEAKRWLEM